MIIYKITNKINNKVYIGQTIRSLKRRWFEHCLDNKIGCFSLHRAIQKYGKENFDIQQIDHAHSRDELDNKEIYWIKYYDSMNPLKGYNLKSGGNTCELSDEVKKRMSKSHIGFRHSDKTKLKMSITRKGKKRGCFSEEWRKNISESHKGYKRTVDSKKKQGESIKGDKNPKSKKVCCVETGEIFAYITLASEVKKVNIHNISSVCNGKRQTAGGFHWRYVNE